MTLFTETLLPLDTETPWPKKLSLRKNWKNTSPTSSLSPSLPDNSEIFVLEKEIFSEGTPLVFPFGSSSQKGKIHSALSLLGSKGANLHEMTALGLPVPPGFTISTQVCQYFYTSHFSYPPSLKEQVMQALEELEKTIHKKLGSDDHPLLVSVRSGSRFSMPGMMDTILNLGLNEKTVQGLIRSSGNEKFSYDSYHRFICMYGEVVLGIQSSEFEKITQQVLGENQLEKKSDLSVKKLKKIIQDSFDMISTQGKIFPQDPLEQLWGAIQAVFLSWMNPRAITYRDLHHIPVSEGTAVTVQAMVFGNRGNTSATGVAFTRDPSSGEKKFFGEFLLNAQGEDVVAGIQTPFPLNKESRHAVHDHSPSLETLMPDLYQELVTIQAFLENHFKDMQDMEFTIENGKLYLLQTRSGKRTPGAALKMAVDMVKENLITPQEALMRLNPEQMNQLLHPRIDPQAKKQLLAQALPASPGAVTGQIVFQAKTAEEWAKKNKKIILVRWETSPEDIKGMVVSEGILTARGGMTSHAAVVARGMGKCCLSGCQTLDIQEEQKTCRIGSTLLKEGDILTLDGSTGEIFLGEVPTICSPLTDDFDTFMTWVNQEKTLQIRANAETKQDVFTALQFHAEGIGLCRTEHMFFHEDRINAVRKMILSLTPVERKKALEEILPMQEFDFYDIFLALGKKPITIRLLDPPLHEFLPQKKQDIQEFAHKNQLSLEEVRKKIHSLKEMNPMLGHRGCRLGISFPEIYQTQIQAIIRAFKKVKQQTDQTPVVEIMIPFVGDWKEFAALAHLCEKEIQTSWKALGEEDTSLPHFPLGTMIELPRAALTAGKIAEYAEFFSFGTNDLTQTTYGLSRDDSSLFLQDYLNAEIYSQDPFVSLDPHGVGRLMQMAVTEGRQTRPDLKIGLCGEQGADPASILLCQKMGLDYVSCSAFRIPVAQLAAAQAALREGQGQKTTD